MKLKTVLIISPYFPPSNAADMQRIRMSLPYYKELGWLPIVVTVKTRFANLVRDPLLEEMLPAGLELRTVNAFSRSYTAKVGLGSIALRSLWFYVKEVNKLLNERKVDLIYFSTTQFPLCVLGAYWKRKFQVPYVIDMQDPWHSEYYQDKPNTQRPPKYWFSYRLNKYLEPVAMAATDGLISVSEKYITDLRQRYPRLQNVPAEVIPFGGFEPDLEVMLKHKDEFEQLLRPGMTNIVYMGRGGTDMHKAASLIFEALKTEISHNPSLFRQFRIYFFGTSYAPVGTGIPSIKPLADKYGVGNFVEEMTDRLAYYQSLAVLNSSSGMLLIGSDDPGYTASKIYPQLLLKKPLIAIFNSSSSAYNILNECVEEALLIKLNKADPSVVSKIGKQFSQWAKGDFNPIRLNVKFDQYTSRSLTAKQTALFEQAISEHERKNSSN